MLKISDLYRNSKDLHILYVEDEYELLSQTKLMFDDFFNFVDTASDGLQAFEKYKRHYYKNNKYYDLIVSDIEMPNLNGFELSKQILEVNNEQVIIILSAHEENRYLKELINIGINSFIHKPIKYNHMIDVFAKNCNIINENNDHRKKDIEIQKENLFLLDINEKLEEKVKIRTLALENQLYFDKLTSLYNQQALEKDIESYSNSSVLILINIDSFQQYNSIYNFNIGNQILIQLSYILKKFNIKSDYKVYRLYSDNFGLLRKKSDKLFNINDEILVIKKAIEDFEFYITTANKYTNINVTIGASINKENSILYADTALRYAKSHNLGYSIYEETLDITNKLKDSHDWNNRISNAIEKDFVIPVFQPIVNINKEIVKYEVLMRIVEYNNGKEVLLSPYLFLKEAIKTKQYDILMKIIINKSFEIMQNKNCDFSINLSFRDVYNKNLINFLKEKINENKSLANRLIIEILESDEIDDVTLMNEFILEFKSFGVKIAIDDFGTGYSNYSRIISLNPDFIKIDGSLIKYINKDKKSYTIVKSIINYAKEESIKTIAEFVHSKEIFDIVKELSVDEFQGFYFSEPLIYPKEKL
ncbi:MAG: REC domain-containing phosphodiesterase [Arcobacter sp.]|nr:REC domain-containing phosphodiesterase [Arcobacter sp.]